MRDSNQAQLFVRTQDMLPEAITLIPATCGMATGHRIALDIWTSASWIVYRSLLVQLSKKDCMPLQDE